MKELIEKLNYYTNLYNQGKEEISDKEWDELYFKLKTLEEETDIIYPNSPTQKIQYTIVDGTEKIKHNHQMLSLAKTKELEEVKKFLGDKDYVIMYKCDGMTASLTYENGKLIGAETRGNGIIGENILHVVKVIKNIPQTIPYKGTLIVDGEILCKYSDFKSFAKDYKNPRNFTAGTVHLLEQKEIARRNLSFIAWAKINNKNLHFSEDLLELKEYGFEIVPHVLSEQEDEETLKAKNPDIPIDGLVYRFNDNEYGDSLGQTAHHFKHSIAYKFYDEEYETVLEDIEWSMGRTGELTPVAIFKPVDIEGSTVSRASLHNISVMEELSKGFERKGDILTVAKINMIIPQIMSWTHAECSSEDSLLSIPAVCPVCGGKTEIMISDSGVKTLICGNPQCQGKLINILDHFCGKKGLDIRGLSKATLQKLIDWGWVVDFEDIFELALHRDEWIKKPGFGVKSVDNILNAIANSCNCTLDKFICAIGIPLIGSSNAKEICKHIDNYNDFKSLIINKFDFTQWDTFGLEKSNSLLNFNYIKADIVADRYLTFENVKKDKEIKTLENITFVVTGSLNQFKNRTELKNKIEELGGKVTGSISKNTQYLINNDINSTSSKNKKAKELNIPIITELDFVKRFMSDV